MYLADNYSTGEQGPRNKQPTTNTQNRKSLCTAPFAVRTLLPLNRLQHRMPITYHPHSIRMLPSLAAGDHSPVETISFQTHCCGLMWVIKCHQYVNSSTNTQLTHSIPAISRLDAKPVRRRRRSCVFWLLRSFRFLLLLYPESLNQNIRVPMQNQTNVQ